MLVNRIDGLRIYHRPVIIVIAESERAVDDVADTLDLHNLSQRLTVGRKPRPEEALRAQLLTSVKENATSAP